jgi:hypothetical protein
MRALANNLIGALKTNPLVLALVVINVLYLGIGFMIHREAQTRYANLIRTLIQDCTQRDK